jgi:hypothetical protein
VHTGRCTSCLVRVPPDSDKSHRKNGVRLWASRKGGRAGSSSSSLLLDDKEDACTSASSPAEVDISLKLLLLENDGAYPCWLKKVRGQSGTGTPTREDGRQVSTPVCASISRQVSTPGCPFNCPML